jgi:NADH-quinone oxidoreductase subunit K
MASTGISLTMFLCVSMSLFLIGLLGIVLNQRNVIIMILSLEILLLGVNLNFLIFSVFMDDMFGQIFALYVLTIAAGESAIGLALLVRLFSTRGNINIKLLNKLNG